MTNAAAKPDWFKNFRFGPMPSTVKVTVGVKLKQMPLGARVAVQFNGPEPADIINFGPSEISSVNENLGWDRTLPEGFECDVMVQIWNGGTPLPENADVQAFLSIVVE